MNYYSHMDGDSDQLTLVDLFCGAGGLSLGLQQAGLKPVYAADKWACAVETYRANLGEHVTEIELTESHALPDADVFAGGPPCQGFSSAGRRVAEDERNSLVRVYANLIATHRPRAFIFENVEGFLTTGTGSFLIDLLDPLIDAGYLIHLRKVNAANYGVPQHRKRTIAIGGLGWDPGFPLPTHAAHGAPGAHLTASYKPPTPSLREALASLPPASTKPHGHPYDHYYKPLEGDDLERAKLLGAGQRMRDLPEHLQHASYRKRASRRVKDGTPSEKRGGAPAGVRRLAADEPSKAITGAALRDFIHFAEDRPLTLRECARLQTFPDWFNFTGKAAERVQQIGNSVPVRLATAVGIHLVNGLKKAEAANVPGRLCSFRPTASGGMSPRLKAVCELVQARYHPEPVNGQGLIQWQT